MQCYHGEENSHIGNDVVSFLEDTIPVAPDPRRAEKEEAIRLMLTDAMCKVRKLAGLTQEEAAEYLVISQSWVSKLESANHDHQVESVACLLP